MKITEIIIPKFMVDPHIFNNNSYIDGIYWEQYLTEQDKWRIAQHRSLFTNNTEFNNGIKLQIKSLLRIKQIITILNEDN